MITLKPSRTWQMRIAPPHYGLKSSFLSYDTEQVDISSRVRCQVNGMGWLGLAPSRSLCLELGRRVSVTSSWTCQGLGPGCESFRYFPGTTVLEFQIARHRRGLDVEDHEVVTTQNDRALHDLHYPHGKDKIYIHRGNEET